jgi:hypothetical protein
MRPRWDITHLQVAFAAAIRYHPVLAEMNCDKWKHVLAGRKLEIKLHSIIGDIFAFLYNELRFPPDDYGVTVSLFFEDSDPWIPEDTNPNAS